MAGLIRWAAGCLMPLALPSPQQESPGAPFPVPHSNVEPSPGPTALLNKVPPNTLSHLSITARAASPLGSMQGEADG